MTEAEYDAAFLDLLNNKYEYVSGRKTIPTLVGQLLTAFYLWPYECTECTEVEDMMTVNQRTEAINSHEAP